MRKLINLIKGVFKIPGELDENQIVTNIYQHDEASIVQLKYNMVFDAYNNVLLSEDIYERVKPNFDVIFVDAFNIFIEELRKKSRRYHPYRPHCENFVLQFSSFKEGDDLKEIVGRNESGAAMYIVSRRQENSIAAEPQEARITKISKMSKVVDAYSIKMARDLGFEIKSEHRFSAPIGGFRMLVASEKEANPGIQKVPCWGKLSAMGGARFEDGERTVGIYYNAVRIGGSDTPREKNGVIGIRIDAGNIPYAVISKEGNANYISGTGLLNGQHHLAPDVRKPLPDGSKILLGDQEIMFTTTTV